MARKTTSKKTGKTGRGTTKTAKKTTAKKPAKKTAKKTAAKSSKKAHPSTKSSSPSTKKSSSKRGSTKVPGPAEIGADLVRLCNLGQADDVVGKWYHQRLVSVEGDGMTTTGLKALAGKYAWWDANHEVHALNATGPFVGHTGFAVRFDITVTPKGGQRTDMSEIAVYTVKAGRIVSEEFMYGT